MNIVYRANSACVCGVVLLAFRQIVKIRTHQFDLVTYMPLWIHNCIRLFYIWIQLLILNLYHIHFVDISVSERGHMCN